MADRDVILKNFLKNYKEFQESEEIEWPDIINQDIKFGEDSELLLIEILKELVFQYSDKAAVSTIRSKVNGKFEDLYNRYEVTNEN